MVLERPAAHQFFDRDVEEIQRMFAADQPPYGRQRQGGALPIPLTRRADWHGGVQASIAPGVAFGAARINWPSCVACERHSAEGPALRWINGPAPVRPATRARQIPPSDGSKG